jgi:hypothetical protein
MRVGCRFRATAPEPAAVMNEQILQISEFCRACGLAESPSAAALNI